MSGWDSYRAVYGAELRAAAREFVDHGWPVVEQDPNTLVVRTGSALDVLEVPAALGRVLCAVLRDGGWVVPVAATPTGAWYFPVTAGAVLPAELAAADNVRLHGQGASILLPPSTVPDGWVHWRVAPALSGYVVPAADVLLDAAVTAVRTRREAARTERADHETLRPGAQRPAGMVEVGTRY